MYKLEHLALKKECFQMVCSTILFFKFLLLLGKTPLSDCRITFLTQEDEPRYTADKKISQCYVGL